MVVAEGGGLVVFGDVRWCAAHLVGLDVIEDVLEGPVGERVALGEAAANGRVLELVDPRALEALPARAPVDHAVRVERLEAALEGLDLADLVVLLNVLLPQVGAVLGVVTVLVEQRHALRGEDLRLEVVLLLDRLEEGERLVEEVEGVDDHDLALARLEVAQLAQQVRDHAVARDHRVREDRVVKVLARRLKREHRLLLEVLEAHRLRLSDEGLPARAARARASTSRDRGCRCRCGRHHRRRRIGALGRRGRRG
jgi:hypothetical protein